MDEQVMGWDPALLRKYSSTGHFRLLNQLKNDLSKRGLNRDQATGELKMPGSSSRSSRRGGGSRTPSTSSVTPDARSGPTRSDNRPAVEQETPATFRQRLSAIDMR